MTWSAVGKGLLHEALPVCAFCGEGPDAPCVRLVLRVRLVWGGIRRPSTVGEGRRLRAEEGDAHVERSGRGAQVKVVERGRGAQVEGERGPACREAQDELEWAQVRVGKEERARERPRVVKRRMRARGAGWSGRRLEWAQVKVTRKRAREGPRVVKRGGRRAQWAWGEPKQWARGARAVGEGGTQAVGEGRTIEWARKRRRGADLEGAEEAARLAQLAAVAGRRADAARRLVTLPPRRPPLARLLPRGDGGRRGRKPHRPAHTPKHEPPERKAKGSL